MLPQLHAYYIARGIFGAMIVLSGIVQIVNIGMTIFTNTAERRRRETLRVAEAIARRRWRADERRSGERDADGRRAVPRGWVRHPRERMLITPLVAGIGGLLAFFTVVAIVVWLPIHTFDPPPSERLGAARRHQARQGPQPVRAERLLRLPLRLLAAAGRPRRRSTSSTRRSRSRATSTAATSRRTCSAPSAPARTSRRSRAGIRTTGSGRTSTTRATSTRCR